MPNNPTHMLKLGLQRITAYIDKLPIFTKAIMSLMIVLEAASLLPWWNIKAWGWLEPDLINLSTLYRTNTFPLIHRNVFHLAINFLGVVPLLERFEMEHGSLPSVALFFGPLSTIPALIYVLIERVLLRANTPIMGSSIWGFLLYGAEAIRANKTAPYLVIRGQPTIPTWTAPIAVLLVAILVTPGSSALGHACGLGVGYVFGLGYLKFLVPPDKVMRFIETRLKLRSWSSYYVSVDQKTYGREGVIPLTTLVPVVGPGLTGSNQRLGPTPV
ncbi:uncharacterized protein B0H64DRAFT_383836 [Chaetomium fimeti]|jgi:glycosylphosphatidylinositol transamidase|uniref:rhomboid protease n=1 Tax=Chaetomium fimeti TaxID=1854472 RepID=A0AAE0HRU4_9PEZI|nr:hypothetical protein B0H64DRAFT_383836 [Chaetomium fimeti]